MKKYSVKQLAKLAGVTIRTLHHYDKIGLLKPAARSEKQYRYYGREELLQLQQILFYKELGFALEEIKDIFNDPGFNMLHALEAHKVALQQRMQHTQQQLVTIDKTIQNLKNNYDMKDEEMYEGLNAAEREAMRKEVREKWGKDKLQQSEDRVRKMGKEGLAKAKAKGESISKRLAELMDLDPAERQVQEVVAQHYQHLLQFTPIDKEYYRGLGKMYTQDERFKAHYDQHKEGLADFLHKGIQIFCENNLQVV